ncbi:hypothetical protein E4U59_000382 [Claviceps monticola]|nr:hypothetical protein E4U59_000382 [Claviceps monticola]
MEFRVSRFESSRRRRPRGCVGKGKTGNWLFAPEGQFPAASSSAKGSTLYAFDRSHWLIGIERLTSFTSKVHHAAAGRLLSNATTLIGQQPTGSSGHPATTGSGH